MRIKYGGGAGHNQSLQNYQSEKGDNAPLGNQVQTSLLLWGHRQGRQQTQERSPTPTRADGLGPALESHLGTQEPVRSVRAERPWRSLCCKMSPPRLTPQVEPPSAPFQRLVDLWLPEHTHCLSLSCCHPWRSLPCRLLPHKPLPSKIRLK